MSNGLTRRELVLMGNAVALPTLLRRLDAPAEAAAAAGPLVAGPQIYQSIGVEPVINCRGTFTIIGGSVERPEVRAAMDARREGPVSLRVTAFAWLAKPKLTLRRSGVSGTISAIGSSTLHERLAPRPNTIPAAGQSSDRCARRGAREQRMPVLLPPQESRRRQRQS
jgi:hypothetical protein